MGALLFCSCGKEQLPVPMKVPVSFVLPPTKADVVTLTSFRCSCFSGSDWSPVTDGGAFADVLFSQSDGVFTGGRYWPSDDPQYHFYASNARILGSGVSQTRVHLDKENTADIVVASCESPSYKTSNSLCFEHITAKVGTITLVAPDGCLCSIDANAVKLRGGGGGYYYLHSQSWSDGEGDSTTRSFAEASSWYGSHTLQPSCTEYFNPSLAYTLEVTYTLSQGGRSVTFTKTGTFRLKQGKKNNLVVTIPSYAFNFDIDVSVEVLPWEQGGNICETF